MSETFDLIVLGGGRAANLAIPAAKAGLKTALIERDRLGGACPNRGCVPSKLLIGFAEAARHVRHADRHFIDAEFRGADVRPIFASVNEYVGGVDGRYQGRVDEAGVTLVRGEGRFVGPKTIAVAGRELTAEKIVVSTGSRPVASRFAHLPVWTSDTLKAMNRTHINLDPSQRTFPAFNLTRLLGTVFAPTEGCRVCILTDFAEPATEIKGWAFLTRPGHAVQKKAHEVFYNGLRGGALEALGLTGGEMFAYRTTQGSNLDLADECWDAAGRQLGLDRDIYSHYDLILCVSSFSATAPLTAKAKQFDFRGATLHGLNDIILRSGLAVDYHEVSRDAEALRLAMTRADVIEIDFELDDGRILTAEIGLDGQEAQKSHGLCLGRAPDIANLPAGEVYFVPTDARGQFPMKYEDGTLGLLEVRDRAIIRSTLIAGNPATIERHNARLAADPVTGTLGELGFGTQILPVSGADIQDEKVLGTCHLATGRDDHLGGDIVPGMFQRHENATHDDILFAPHKSPNFNLRQVRMRRGSQHEILIENFRPSAYLIAALQAVRTSVPPPVLA